jgi:hypothetical protein
MLLTNHKYNQDLYVPKLSSALHRSFDSESTACNILKPSLEHAQIDLNHYLIPLACAILSANPPPATHQFICCIAIIPKDFQSTPNLAYLGDTRMRLKVFWYLLQNALQVISFNNRDSSFTGRFIVTHQGPGGGLPVQPCLVKYSNAGEIM